MHWEKHFHPIIYYLLLSFFYLFTIWNGLQETYDSQEYIAAAKSFAKDHLFKNTDGTYYAHWPPLYPLILSFFLNDLKGFLILFNYLCLIGIFTTMSIISDKLLINGNIKIIYKFLICIALPLFLIGRFVWSEPFFLLLFSIQLYYIQKYWKDTSVSNLLVISILSILYCLQRKAGLFFVIGITMSFFLESRSTKDLKNASVFFGVSLLFIPLWQLLTSFSFPINQTSNNSLAISKVSLFFLQCLSNWFLPPFLPQALLVIVGIIIISLLLYSFLFRKTGVCGIYLLCLLAYFFAMQLFPYHDFTETERYLSVIYPIFVLLFLKAIESFKETNISKSNFIINVCLWIWVCYSFFRTSYNVIKWNNFDLSSF